MLASNDVPLPVTAESLAADRIEYATWLMLFAPSMVETYGRESLLATPVWHADDLDDGAVLLIATPNPLGEEGTAAIDDHLGIDRPAELEGHQY